VKVYSIVNVDDIISALENGVIAGAEYIDEMKKQDLDVMSEFLVMAATLLNIKSKMLLPKEAVVEEEEEDPRAELVQQLLEYKMYRTYAYELRDRQVDANQIFYKEPTIPDEVLAYEEPVDVDQLISDLTLNKLNVVFQSVIKRQKNRVDPVRSRFGEIKKEEVSVEDKMIEISEYARNHKTFSFRELLEKQSSKVQIVVTFLVILELMKAGEIRIVQENIFDDIKIESQLAA
jgi:segregation and condensation protein A